MVAAPPMLKFVKILPNLEKTTWGIYANWPIDRLYFAYLVLYAVRLQKTRLLAAEIIAHKSAIFFALLKCCCAI